jgi:hypothetical protein
VPRRILNHVKTPAPEELLDRNATVLADLAIRHGLTQLRHGGPGTVAADVEPGRTLNDLAQFELEAESLLESPRVSWRLGFHDNGRCHAVW